MRGGVLATATLWWRELERFLRQPSRIGSAVGTPLLFWILIGSGFSGSFRLPGAPRDVDYLRYFFPGTLVLLVLFAAIFSSISIIEDRREGFLQSVLVAPVSRGAVVAGKVLGGATLAWLQGLVLLLLAPLAGIDVTAGALLAGAGVIALLALALTAVGFAGAWLVDSTQGFHGVMNLLLMPLWLLSGALFPIAGAAGWLAVAMRFNPLTYGVAALRHALDPAGAAGAGQPGMGVSLAVLGGFGVAALVVDGVVVKRR